MSTANKYSTGRDLSWDDLKAALGSNLMAISGGRADRLGKSTISMPVASGYSVRVTIAGNDTFTVERVLTRSGVATVKAIRTDVYVEEVGEACYRASCYLDAF